MLDPAIRSIEPRLVSIIINNYNYGCFLRYAIESALSQTYPNTEVIVVDDGSTDKSGEIIAGYGKRVMPVLKENGGQASALNAGFSASRGDVVCFLDADDALLPDTLQKAAPLVLQADVTKVHWPMWITDRDGRRTGEIQSPTLTEGNLRERVIQYGPEGAFPAAPTSGNAWARWFLERVLPLPQQGFEVCGSDSFLSAMAPAFGLVRKLSMPQGLYRKHDANNYTGKTFEERLRFGLFGYEQKCLALSRAFDGMGIHADTNAWKQNSWWPRVAMAVSELDSLLSPGSPFILVDEEQWGVGAFLAGRRRIPFLEREGQYWGPPPDDQMAIAELERLRRHTAHFIVFAWPAFWWLDHYHAFRVYLYSRFRCLVRNNLLVVFFLQGEPS